MFLENMINVSVNSKSELIFLVILSLLKQETATNKYCEQELQDGTFSSESAVKTHF